MPSPRLTLLAATCAGLAACGDGSNPTRGGIGTGGEIGDAGIALPEGFAATVFADGLDRPRHMAVSGNGDVYVTLRSDGEQGNGPGAVAALRDEDGDGRADRVERFGRHDAHTGMTIHDDTLYYSSTTAIYATALEGGDLVPAGEPEVVVEGLPPSGSGHPAKPVTLDDEGHLYTQAGVPSNACQEEPGTPGSPGLEPCPHLEDHGRIWRYSAESRNQQHPEDAIVLSTGHRNVVALEWNPTVENLYMVMHGRDQLDQLWPEHYTAAERAELPAEEFHVVEQGDDFGWPYTYYDPLRGERMVAPEYGGDGEIAAQRGEYKEPLIAFPAHWAPNDLLFYTAQQFPVPYRNGAFIAFHGSWNRAPQPQGGYSIVYAPLTNGRPSGNWTVFADGFAGPEAVSSPAEAEHRPTGLALGPDGSLYISDDTGGRIWKVTYEGS